MQKIYWCDDFSVGVPILDAQHKQFIDIVNRCIFLNKMQTDLILVADTLGRMKCYANEHFPIEENLLRQVQYPDLDEHRNRHQSFIRTIVDCCIGEIFRSKVESGEIIEYLHDWWHSHILEDMKYRPYLVGK
jgi:hemerythrin